MRAEGVEDAFGYSLIEQKKGDLYEQGLYVGLYAEAQLSYVG